MLGRKSLLVVFILQLLVANAGADGGMYPISMLDQLPLKEKGLRISTKDIFNPNGDGGLVRAVVQIGGCTGSFVSPHGLIVTNHHCAFSSLSAYSTPENNLFEKGYLAKDQQGELPVKGMTCRILESFKDVSAEVLKGTENAGDGVVKKNIIENNIHVLTSAESMRSPGLEIVISEMLPGKSYILFRYKTIKDIRIVYVPARNIGEFGGETDNWEWPRHNGDFSFLRAYVSKDGSPSVFDKSNVPYEPKEYLNISGKGVAENDFVFILGYPGRTFRNQPAAFLNLQQQYTLPIISNLYFWQINAMKTAGQLNQNWLVGKEPRMKSLANVAKNFAGKMKGLNGLDLYDARKEEEKSLMSQLGGADQARFATLLRSTDSVYTLAEKTYASYIWRSQALNENNTLRIANLLSILQKGGKKNLTDSLTAPFVKDLRQAYTSLYKPYDTMYLRKMLQDATHFSDGSSIPEIVSFNPTEERFRDWFQKTKIYDSTYIIGLIKKKSPKFFKLKDPMISLAADLVKGYQKIDSAQQIYKAAMDALLPKYVDLKMKAQDGQFIPDANLTLRITYGYVKGYSPVDGEYDTPFTTVSGMLEKGKTGIKDYQVNDILKGAWQRYLEQHSDANKTVPVCILYNTDTTGGNSGSPILNQYGQLVGLNFDRTFEATINDYAWNDKYSRSIGVDMRFVIWTLKNVANADYLVNEMFIDK
jgi:hypothetical protein